MSQKTVVCLFLVLTLLVAGCAPRQSLAITVPKPDYWPTAGWRSSTPEAQGMDSIRLAQMVEELSAKKTRIHSVLVIRNGYLVTEAYFHPYTRETKVHIQSVTKSVIGILVGKAIGEGYIQSEEQLLLDFYPDQAIQNTGREKDTIQLKHLLSMSSGLDCEEFSSASTMEQSEDWVQFALDLPMLSAPGKRFGYCNANAHLLSSLLQGSTGMSTREYANRALFEPLGIPPVDEADWGSDPQEVTMGGYGLHLRPLDLARLALLSLHNGVWEDQQLLPAAWITASTTQHIQKQDGSGYGYLWTVYPKAGHYAALGLGGQQIHVFPSRNLIVVVTAALESFAEAPEIESMLDEYILPAIESDRPLARNPVGLARLQAGIDTAANPVQPVPSLPATALEISGSTYRLEENPLDWQELSFRFEEDASTARLDMTGFPPLEIGLDNLYRLNSGEAIGSILLRGRWLDGQTFVVDYPYPIQGKPVLGELGETQLRFAFHGDALEIAVDELIFGSDPLVLRGAR